MHAQDFHVLANMLKAGGTLITVATGDMGFSRNSVSLLEIGHILADFNHFGGILMTEEEGKLDPGSGIFVPLVNVDISPANGCSLHPHQQVVIPDLGCGKIGVCRTSDRFIFD